MFERFSQEARHVIVLAEEEARGFKHPYIGTEHLLLGLIREEEERTGDEPTLRSLGVTLTGARDKIWRLVPPGDEDSGAPIPFTPRAKKVLELALREALTLGHTWLAPEHVLLGIVRENEGIALRVLLDFDVDPLRVRNEVLRVLEGLPQQRPTWKGAAGRPMRVPVDIAFFVGLVDVLTSLASEVRHTLGRQPDSGDLLLAIACARETIAARALNDLGVSLDDLQRTLEHVRQHLPEAPSDPGHRIEDVHASPETSSEVLSELRRRLGLPQEDG